MKKRMSVKKLMNVLCVATLFCLLFSTRVFAYDKPNLASVYYLGTGQGGYNKMTVEPYLSNCHFFTWGRVYEKLGVELGTSVGSWYKGKPVYDTPRGNSIALWGEYGNMGHSVFVESVSNGIISFTEGGHDNGSGKRGFNEGSVSIEKFSNIRSDLPFWGYVYIGEEVNLPVSSIQISAKEVQNISLNNAVPYGHIIYTGSKPSEIGLYLSESPNPENIVAKDKGSSIANENSFDMWFDLNKEANLILTPGTKYYYRFYVIQNGIETKTQIEDFVTLDAPKETKIQYAYRIRPKNIERIESKDAEVAGYTQVGSYGGEYSVGEWSPYQNTPIEDNGNVEIETREVVLRENELITLWRYYSESQNSFSPYQLDESYQLEGGKFPIEKVTFIGQSYRGGRKDCYKVEGYNYYFFPIGESGGERVIETEKETQYRFRTINEEKIYQFEKVSYGDYSEWSEWQDEVVEANDITEVQTREVIK